MKKQLPLLFIIIAIQLAISGCGNHKTKQQVDFPEVIPGKIVFSTSRSQHGYSTALYENGSIRIVREDGGLIPQLSPNGKKMLINAPGGIDIYDLNTNIITKILQPELKVDTSYEKWFESNEKILVISRNALGVREKIPYDLYQYDLIEKKWTKLTNYKPDEGILSFDVFKDGKRILCSYSSDYKIKGRGNRGTYIMALETGTMRKITNWAGSYEIMPDQKSFLAETAIRKGGKVVAYSDLLLVNMETGSEKRLTFDGLPKSTPTVSADGQWALYSVSGGGMERIFMLHIPTGATKEMFDRPIAYAGKIAHDRNPDWVS